MPNFRRKARGRPQILHRLCLRVENFGFLTFCGFTLLSAPSFTRFAVVAKFAPNYQLPTFSRQLSVKPFKFATDDHPI